jgi:hypothetical protein
MGHFKTGVTAFDAAVLAGEGVQQRQSVAA